VKRKIIWFLVLMGCFGMIFFGVKKLKNPEIPSAEVKSAVLAAISQKIDLKKLDPDMRLIWIAKDEKGEKIQPVLVRIGITDGTYTEIKEVIFGEIKEGEFVVTGRATADQINTRTPDINQVFRSLR